MEQMKICNRCNQRKAVFLFSKHKGHKYGVNAVCKKCDIARKHRLIEMAIGWVCPWKNINQPKYIEARNKFFEGNNGWWCNDGKGWELNPESPAEKARKRRKKNEITKVKMEVM